ncbi:MAG TPA: GDP-mannose 4,6-dehydratase, partial [Spirochaetota bacterium]|nr:GDP-mannose 4,6-dehydratase [Spirochaetota bacterium]
MKVALTGGTGFIGSYIAMELVSSGHEVKILARNADKVPFLHSVKGIE